MKDRLTLWLNEWGAIYWQCLTDASYPRASSIVRVIEDQTDSTGIFRHKVLCRDMSSHVATVHRAVLSLPDAYRIPICILFMAPLKPDGSRYTQRELAQLVSLDKCVFRQRISRGKERLRNSLCFDAFVTAH